MYRCFGKHRVTAAVQELEQCYSHENDRFYTACVFKRACKMAGRSYQTILNYLFKSEVRLVLLFAQQCAVCFNFEAFVQYVKCLSLLYYNHGFNKVFIQINTVKKIIAK